MPTRHRLFARSGNTRTNSGLPMTASIGMRHSYIKRSVTDPQLYNKAFTGRARSSSYCLQDDHVAHFCPITQTTLCLGGFLTHPPGRHNQGVATRPNSTRSATDSMRVTATADIVTNVTSVVGPMQPSTAKGTHLLPPIGADHLISHQGATSPHQQPITLPGTGGRPGDTNNQNGDHRTL